MTNIKFRPIVNITNFNKKDKKIQFGILVCIININNESKFIIFKPLDNINFIILIKNYESKFIIHNCC